MILDQYGKPAVKTGLDLISDSTIARMHADIASRFDMLRVSRLVDQNGRPVVDSWSGKIGDTFEAKRPFRFRPSKDSQ